MVTYFEVGVLKALDQSAECKKISSEERIEFGKACT